MRQRLFLLAVLLLLFSGIAFARGGGGCFLPGTTVATPSGGMAIENISAGQAVLSFDGSGVVQSAVSEIYEVERDHYFEISAAGSTVRATAEHPFYVGGGKFVEAAGLEPGATVYLLSDGRMKQAKISAIARIDAKVVAYNLHTGLPNTFFADGFAVHNKGGCFEGSTLIACPNGTEPIAGIKVGDAVLSFEGNETVSSYVSEKYALTADGYYQISTSSSTVNATAGHPFYTPGGYVEAQDLQVGGTVFARGQNGSLVQEKITGKVLVSSPITVYNLQVDGAHTFFANDFAVHNKGGCFLPGTKISTAQGEAPIESLGEGSEVYSFSENGSVSLSRVSAKYTVSRDSYYEISAGGRVVRATAEHPFYTGSGYKTAEELRAGDTLYGLSAGSLSKVQVGSVRLVLQPTVAYNLEVDGDHTFFAEGIAVHNKGGGGGGGGGRSGPPPNTFYYDCNRTYNNSAIMLPCCRQVSAQYSASGAAIARQGYSACSCVSGSTAALSPTFRSGSTRCVCTNIARYDPVTSSPAMCPFDPVDFFGTTILPILVLAATVAAIFRGQQSYPKYKLHLMVAGGIIIFAELALFSIIGVLVQLLSFMPICCVGIYILVIAGAAFGKGRGAGILSSLGNGEWSSTASAPEGKVKAKAGKVSALLAFWAKIDSAWDETAMEARAKAVFLKLQECWGKREYSEMEPLLMPAIYAQHTAQLEAMAARHEINRMENLRLLDMQIVLVKRFDKKEKDEFTAWVKATARDTIVDDRTGKKIRGDTGNGVFEEFWTFARDGDSWKLREIDQPEEGMHVIGEPSFDESATPVMMSALYERSTTGKQDTSVAAMREQGGEGPAMGEIKEKGGKIHRMLNFLAQTDRAWDEQKMLELARTLFILLSTSVEKRSLSRVAGLIKPALLATIQANVDGMRKNGLVAQKGNLAIRNVEIVLVRNFNDRTRDEFVAWVSGQAQNVLVDERTERVVSGDSYVRDFEEYWTFVREGSAWKLSSIDGSMAGAGKVSQENVDEGTSKDMLQWYYTKDRAL